ncbi:aspartate carbamoyltransferase catalytic subunit [Chlamydiota bacterium]
MEWTKKDLLGINELSPDEIIHILDTAESFKEILQRPIKKVPALRGKTVANLFFEASTRTRASFELAAKKLSADTVNVTTTSSSLTKGETLKDTAKNLISLKVDILIIRHSAPGAPYYLAQALPETAIINAGDGSHEHPTQALLDIFTIREKKGTIKGLTVTIIGDILHSRVARSNIWGLKKLGAQVVLAGPRTLMPPHIDQMGVEVTDDVSLAVKKADVINVLRIQLERQKEIFFPSLREYAHFFGIHKDTFCHAKKDVLIMHPGPINRGIELSSAIADGPSSVILDQVSNGLAIRMAVLYLIAGKQGVE